MAAPDAAQLDEVVHVGPLLEPPPLVAPLVPRRGRGKQLDEGPQSVEGTGGATETRMPNVAFVSSKGGAGKTTAALQLALGLAEWGLRVALIDAEPRTNP